MSNSQQSNASEDPSNLHLLAPPGHVRDLLYGYEVIFREMNSSNSVDVQLWVERLHDVRKKFVLQARQACDHSVVQSLTIDARSASWRHVLRHPASGR